MALISLGELSSAVHRFLRGTGITNSAGLAIGGTTSKVKTAVAVDYKIDGLFYAKAITDDLFTLSGTALASGQCCTFLLCLDASGNATAVQGPIATGTTATFPDPTASTCPIGYIKVVAAATFTPGTTALNAANITTTYYNGSCAPLTGTV